MMSNVGLGKRLGDRNERPGGVVESEGGVVSCLMPWVRTTKIDFAVLYQAWSTCGRVGGITG